MERTVEIYVVAPPELSLFDKDSTYIRARRSCVAGVDERVAHVVFDVTRKAVVIVIAILLYRVEISAELCALLLWIRSSMFITYVVEKIFGGWTLVVTVSAFVVSADTVALRPKIHR